MGDDGESAPAIQLVGQLGHEKDIVCKKEVHYTEPCHELLRKISAKAT